MKSLIVVHSYHHNNTLKVAQVMAARTVDGEVVYAVSGRHFDGERVSFQRIRFGHVSSIQIQGVALDIGPESSMLIFHTRTLGRAIWFKLGYLYGVEVRNGESKKN